MEKSTEERLDELFEKWRTEPPYKEDESGRNSFIRDGIVNYEKWNESEPKICYLLKEAYIDKEKEYREYWDIADALNKSEPWGVFKKIAVWTEGICKAFNGKFLYEDIADKKKNTDKIALVNVKKWNGKKSSVMNELIEIARYDKKNLLEELEIINPDIIVCGYTMECLRQIIGEYKDFEEYKFEEDKNAWVGRWGDKMILNYYHPANRGMSTTAHYYALIALYHAAAKKYGDKLRVVRNK